MKQEISEQQDLVTLSRDRKIDGQLPSFSPSQSHPGGGATQVHMKEGKPLEAGHHSHGRMVQATRYRLRDLATRSVLMPRRNAE